MNVADTGPNWVHIFHQQVTLHNSQQCPIAAKIAGSIGIRICRAVLKKLLFHIGGYELSHHTLCMGNLVWFQ